MGSKILVSLDGRYVYCFLVSAVNSRFHLLIRKDRDRVERYITYDDIFDVGVLYIYEGQETFSSNESVGESIMMHDRNKR